jgi:hypothetical protein
MKDGPDIALVGSLVGDRPGAAGPDDDGTALTATELAQEAA